MARNSIPKLSNWAEVDEALRQIGEHNLQIEAKENYLRQCVQRITQEINETVRPMQDEIDLLERQVRQYVDKHREELGEGKSRELVYGTVRYRLSMKILGVPRDPEKLAVLISKMRQAHMNGALIPQQDRISKEELRNYDSALLAQVGLTKQVSDTWGYDLKIDQIRAARSKA